ncbi:MAG: glycosyltransferase family 4 protein [Tissierellia bacterium]|nr:glycosyltransferase family 4 protein [Tissierellia bacterium]
MKILQICSYYSDSKLYQNLFDALKKKGVESDIFYFTDKNKDISKIPKDLMISNKYNPIDRLLFFRKHRIVYKDLLNMISFGDYNISHSHSLMSNGYISYLLKKEFGIKYITAVRRTDLFIFLKYKPYLKKMASNIINESSGIIFLSEVFKDKTKEILDGSIDLDLFEENSFIIPNGIEDKFLLNTYSRDMTGKLKFIFVGKIDDPNKNIKTIIKACDQLVDRGEKVELRLVGRLDNKRFKELISKKDYIVYIPQTDSNGVMRELRKSDIFIMPSFTETFGLSYVEAMSQGLPVIYTEGQGFDGQFPDGLVGYPVNPKSPVDIIEKIDLITDNYKKISLEAVKKSKKFNWESIAEIYKQIYFDIL